MIGQRADIGTAFSEGGEGDGNDAESVEEVLTEAALLDRAVQVAVGRGHNPYVDMNGLPSTNGNHFATLKHSQKLRLQLNRHIADLVEKQSSAGGFSKPPEAR